MPAARNPHDEAVATDECVLSTETFTDGSTMSTACAELETLPQSERFVTRQRATRPTLLHCLVVAADAERRAFLARAAREAGWEVAVYADAHAASVAAQRFGHSLAIVDLEGLSAEQAREVRTLTEQLSTSSQPLLMVCGTEGNALEEIWARQLGVWLYLSGVDPSCDLETLCSEAKQVVEKLHAAATPKYARTA